MCSHRFIKPGSPVCGRCAQSLLYTMPEELKAYTAAELDSALKIARRSFYFGGFYYIWHYEGAMRELYRQAKFNRRRLSEKFIYKYAKNILLKNFIFANRARYIFVPLISSFGFVYKLASFLNGETSKKSLFANNLSIHKLFYKARKHSIKKDSRNVRFDEVENSLQINAEAANQLKSLLDADTKVLLMDDLWSTGATMNRACRLLHENGVPVENIGALVIFFNPPKDWDR